MFNNYNYVNSDDFLGSNVELKEFDYNSFYRALVVSNTDSENLGRIRVRIPSLHYNTEDKALPYAYPGCFAGLGNQMGPFYLPPVGSIVFVGFEFSDEHRPIYFGGVPTKPYEGKTQYVDHSVNGGKSFVVDTDDIPTEYKGSQAIIYKSATGNIIYMDDSTDKQGIKIVDSQKQEISVINGYDRNKNLKKYVIMKTDKDNKLKLEPDKLTLTISGSNYVFDKAKLDEIFNR